MAKLWDESMKALDILHDTPIYQLILEEGREKGLEQARDEERLNMRMILVNITQARFPDLVSMVRARTDSIEDIDALRQLVINSGRCRIGRKSSSISRLMINLPINVSISLREN